MEQKAHLTGRMPGHAGAFETSEMMSLRPDPVRKPLPHRDEVTASSLRGFLPAVSQGNSRFLAEH